MAQTEVVVPDAPLSEASLLPMLMSTQESPDKLIPDDIDSATLKQYLSITSRAYLRAQDAAIRLKPFLGRILLIYKMRPDLWRGLGFGSYDEWMTEGVRKLHGISRGESYNCVTIAEELGYLPAEKMQALGISKLTVISKIARQSIPADMTLEMRHEKINEWVVAAETNTAKALIEMAEAQNVVEVGSLVPKAVISISVNPTVKEFWESLCLAPEVHAYCESQDPGVIFERALQDCSTEWQAQAHDSRRNGHAQE